jgi:hypothetical protein
MSSTGCRAIAVAVVSMLGCGGGGEQRSAATPLVGKPAQASGGHSGPSYEQERGETQQKDSIQVRGTKGYLEMHEIQAGVKPHHDAFDACYQSRLKERRFIYGDLTLEIMVRPTGDVGTARLTESDVGDWTVERCVLDEARRMRFAQPKGGNRQAVFSVPLNFTSDQGGIEVWPEERVAAVVAAKADELAACSPAPGEVSVTLYVGNRGKVMAVGFSSAHARPVADGWADCAAGVLAAWTFEDPRGKIVKSRFLYRPEMP